MYAEVLLTPHGNRASAQDQQALLLDTLPAYQPHVGPEGSSQSERFAHMFAVADGVAETVHQSLIFRSNNDGQYDMTLEAVGNGQQANCHGHTIVLSECLDYVGIPHHIAYANGHSFALLTDFGVNTYFLDAVSPYFNGSMHGAVNTSDLAEAPGQIATAGYGAVRFRTDIFVDSNMKLNHELDSLSTKHQWLTKDKKISLGSGHGMAGRHLFSRGRFIRNHTLVMSIHEPESGRRILEEYERFKFSNAHGKTSEAYKHLRAISGRFPEIDSMVPRDNVEQFAYALAGRGYVALAVKAAEAVGDTYRPEISSDVRLQSWRGDILREIGRIAHDPQIIDRAITLYENAPNGDTNIHLQGKVRKARRIQAAI